MVRSQIYFLINMRCLLIRHRLEYPFTIKKLIKISGKIILKVIWNKDCNTDMSNELRQKYIF